MNSHFKLVTGAKQTEAETEPCERCENSSKLRQIKSHFMTPLIIHVEILVCQKICVWFFLVVFFAQNVVSI